VAEIVTLDPAAVATSRTALEITPYIAAGGPDWGDSDIEAYVSDQAVGSSAVDYRLPNRIIKIPLSLRTLGATSFATIRLQLQQKAALLQREGGFLMRQIDSTPLYADVVKATLHLGGSWLQAYRSVDVDAVLTLECVPDWYGDEVTLTTLSGTGSAIGKLQLSGADAVIAGNHPGRVRIDVTDTSGNNQLGLLWAWRSKNYDAAATARLSYEADTLHPINGAAGSAVTGASGGTAVFAIPPSGVWVPLLHTDIGGTAALTHQGSYRVWMRGSASATPTLRFKWGVGSLSSPVLNDAVQVADGGGFRLLDLGPVRLDPAPVGTHRWGGVVEVETAADGDTIAFDQLFFQPLDESAGQLTYGGPTPPASSIGTLAQAGSASNDATSGTINWTNLTAITAVDNNKATATMTFGQTSKWLKTGGYGFAIPSTATIKGIEMHVWEKASTNVFPISMALQVVKAGVIGLTAPYSRYDSAGGFLVYGDPTSLWGTTWTYSDINNAGFGAALQVIVGGSSGSCTAYVDAIAIVVYYTLASGFTVAQDAVIYANGIAEISTDGCYRDAGGGVYGPVSQVIGDIPRIPPSGLEARPVELFVKPSRGDFNTVADSGIDGVSVPVKYRASYLYVGQ
jgi:hypothetical protein